MSGGVVVATLPPARPPALSVKTRQSVPFPRTRIGVRWLSRSEVQGNKLVLGHDDAAERGFRSARGLLCQRRHALPQSSYPNAWIVLGAEDLTKDERAKLEAIAPVFADPYSPDMVTRRRWAESLPIHFEGEGLGGLSFANQHLPAPIAAVRTTSASGQPWANGPPP
jgi:hypothetical protein